MEQQQQPLFNLGLTPEAKNHLGETARWAKFLAICAMVFLVLMMIMGAYLSFEVSRRDAEFREITRGSSLTTEGLGMGMMFVYLLVGLLYFFPCLFTLQFANKMKLALVSNDDLLLSESFRSLKKTFRYLGVITIIFLVFFLLGLISGGLEQIGR